MKDKHKIFDLLLSGKTLDKKTKELFSSEISRFNDIMLCERMKWNETIINETSVSFYKDTVLILQLQSIKEKKEQTARKRKV